MAEYKNQHFVPQFYLRGFIESDDNISTHTVDSLWILDKNNSNKITRKGIKNICSESYYHSYINNDQYDHTVEKHLAIKENDFKQALEEITSNAIKINEYSSSKHLKAKDRKTLLEFIYYQIIRVPNFINMANDIIGNGFSKINQCEGVYQTNQEIINDVKMMAFPKLFIDDNFNKNISILNMKNWTLWVISNDVKGSFVSSDNPIMITNPVRPNALIDPMTEISLFLNNKIALSLHQQYGSPKYYYSRITSIETVKKMNALCIQYAKNIAYSGKKEMLET